MDELKERIQEDLRDRYLVGARLGRGESATVFEARDLRHRRSVAIKVLDPEAPSAIREEKFRHEIEIVAGLAHPHILPLHDSGVAGGLQYFVMPLIQGRTLRDRLEREGPLAVPDALQIAAEVGSALDYAHKRGIVHRDIKPGNILIESGHAFVADFGLARFSNHGPDETQAEEPSAPSATMSGTIAGTPLYMSPEQASSEKVDGRSDVYALGCVLYEMLAGKPPFVGGTVSDLLKHHQESPPPGLRLVRPEVGEAVERAVRRALAKAPQQRPRDAAEFVAELRKLAAEPAASRQFWPVIALAALAVVGVVGWWMIRQPSRPPAADVRRLADMPFTNRSADPADELPAAGSHRTNAAARQAYERGRNHWNRRTREDLRLAVDDFRSATRLDPSFALAWVGLADSYGLLPQYDQVDVDDVMRRAQEAARRAIALDGTLAEAYASLGNVEKNWTFDWRAADSLYRKAIALNPNYATAHHWLAVMRVWRGDVQGGLPEIERATQLDPRSPVIHLTQARICYLLRQYPRAIREYQVALDLDSTRSAAWRGLSDAYFQQGRVREASAAWERSLSCVPDSLGLRPGPMLADRHGYLVRRLTTARGLQRAGVITPAELAAVCANLGRNDEAFALLDRARMDELVYGDLNALPDYDALRSDPRFPPLEAKVRHRQL